MRLNSTQRSVTQRIVMYSDSSQSRGERAQLTSPQLNPTQLNLTQRNPTQLNTISSIELNSARFDAPKTHPHRTPHVPWTSRTVHVMFRVHTTYRTRHVPYTARTVRHVPYTSRTVHATYRTRPHYVPYGPCTVPCQTISCDATLLCHCRNAPEPSPLGVWRKLFKDRRLPDHGDSGHLQLPPSRSRLHLFMTVQYGTSREVRSWGKCSITRECRS